MGLRHDTWPYNSLPEYWSPTAYSPQARRDTGVPGFGHQRLVSDSQRPFSTLPE